MNLQKTSSAAFYCLPVEPNPPLPLSVSSKLYNNTIIIIISTLYRRFEHGAYGWITSVHNVLSKYDALYFNKRHKIN